MRTAAHNIAVYTPLNWMLEIASVEAGIVNGFGALPIANAFGASGITSGAVYAGKQNKFAPPTGTGTQG